MVADSRGSAYRALELFEEGRGFSDAVVVFEGDHGGQIYLTCPLAQVRCSESVLMDLLRDIDALEWDDPSGARLFYERIPTGAGVAGGMGGGMVTDGVWVHPRLAQKGLTAHITEVIQGSRSRLTDE